MYLIVLGSEKMHIKPSEEAIREFYLQYYLSVNAAKTYYDNSYFVVLQDVYYKSEFPKRIEFLTIIL